LALTGVLILQKIRTGAFASASKLIKAQQQATDSNSLKEHSIGYEAVITPC
jgi:hypothetical protein